MTNYQIKFLRYINNDPKSISQIYKKFNIDYYSLVNFINDEDLKSYVDFIRKDVYENSLIIITNKGKSFLENRTRTTLFWLIPTLISLLALITSIFAIISV